MKDRRKVLAKGRKGFYNRSRFELALYDLWVETTGNRGSREEMEGKASQGQAQHERHQRSKKQTHTCLAQGEGDSSLLP